MSAKDLFAMQHFIVLILIFSQILILGFTSCIILFSLVSFLLVIICHLYMLLQKKNL